MNNVIGLIPARRGSKRVPGKNMALLNGKPLLQYAIESAKESKIFKEIIVSSDWDECLALADSLGVSCIQRPAELCQDSSHDYEWVSHALSQPSSFRCDSFAILRPTSPFRTAFTIIKAFFEFSLNKCDSLRAVEKTRSHPGKSWILFNGYMMPMIDEKVGGFPGYDLSTQALGEVYCQNGCIHIAHVQVLEKYHNVSGELIRPYFTTPRESIDINTPEDLQYAEWLIERGRG